MVNPFSISASSINDVFLLCVCCGSLISGRTGLPTSASLSQWDIVESGGVGRRYPAIHFIQVWSKCVNLFICDLTIVLVAGFQAASLIWNPWLSLTFQFIFPWLSLTSWLVSREIPWSEARKNFVPATILFFTKNMPRNQIQSLGHLSWIIFPNFPWL